MTTRILTFLAVFLTTLGAFAQGDDKYGETEEQQLACKEALQLYRTYRDQDLDHDAYKFWQRVLVDCPGDVSQNVYIDGAKFIKNELKLAETKEHKLALIDSLWMVYDMRMEYFPSTKSKPNNRCHILGYKAMDFVGIYGDKKELEALPWFEESVMCLKEKSRAAFLSKYYELLAKTWQAEEDSLVKDSLYNRVLNEYLMLGEWCDMSITKANNTLADEGASAKAKKYAERDVEGYAKAKKNIDEIFVAMATCDKMLPVMEAKIAADPNNLELMKRALRLFNKKDCTDSDLYLQIATKVCEAEPKCDCKYSLALGYAKKGEKATALKYAEEAVEMCGDSPDKLDIFIKAAQIASANGQHSKARGYARKVLDIDPNNGEAYIVIGDAIAGSYKQCDDGGVGAASAFWLAVDYYARAKAKDSSVSDRANQRIASNSKQFPSREDLFNYGLKEGQSFQTCFGESTTVRERK